MFTVKLKIIQGVARRGSKAWKEDNCQVEDVRLRSRLLCSDPEPRTSGKRN